MSDVASRSVRARAGGHALLLTAGALAAAALVGWLGLRASGLVGGRQGAWRVDDVVELSAAVAGALVAAWLAVSAAVTAVCLVARVVGASWSSGERLVHRWAPLVVRRALVVAVGAGLGLGLTTTAQAATAPAPAPVAAVAATDDLGWVVTATPGPTTDASAGTPPAPAAGTSGEHATGSLDASRGNATGSLDASRGAATGSPGTAGADAPGAVTASASGAPGDVPAAGSASGAVAAGGGAGGVGDAAPAGSASVAVEPDAGRLAGVTPVRASVPTAGASPVVVVRGDTLWDIAARHLPAGATDADIARAWPAWYDANRGVVGDDPDVLLPGQVLTVPAGAQR